MKKANLSVVISAYDEEENIEDLTERLLKVLPQISNDFEIIYVVDGEDKTKEKIESFRSKNIKLIYNKTPLGLPAAFKIGFNNVSEHTEYVVTMDADLNHAPEELPNLLNKIIESGADITIGSRELEGSKVIDHPFLKRALSKFTNILFSILTGLNITDKTSGFRIYKKEAILRLSNAYKSKDFEFVLELLLLAKKYKYSINEVPITFTFRKKGKSKLDILKVGIGYLKLLIHWQAGQL